MPLKRPILTILLCFLCTILSAQELKVIQVQEEPRDLSAHSRPRKDVNGELCALLRVSVPSVKGIQFSGNIVGSIEYSGGVYSIYVPAGTKHILYRHEDYFPGEIDLTLDGSGIEGGMVYSIKMSAQSASIETSSLNAQDMVEEEAIPFQLVETKPSFQGGDADDFSRWVNQHLVYPEKAKEEGIQGRVLLQFTVMQDGSIRNVKVLRGTNELFIHEAVRVVSSSPLWIPGTQHGKKVKVTYTFPVIFQLRGTSKDEKKVDSQPTQ